MATNHISEAKTWLNQEYANYPINTNEERHSYERDAVQQAQAHALVSIAESLEKIAGKIDGIGNAIGNLNAY